jgi:hypothetical protein
MKPPNQRLRSDLSDPAFCDGRRAAECLVSFGRGLISVAPARVYPSAGLRGSSAVPIVKLLNYSRNMENSSRGERDTLEPGLFSVVGWNACPSQNHS